MRPRCGGAGIAVSEAYCDFERAGATGSNAGVAGGATAVTLGWPERRRRFLDGGGALEVKMRRCGDGRQ